MSRSSIHRSGKILLQIRTSRALKSLCMSLFGLCILCDAFSQPLTPELRIAVREQDNTAYIYHTAMPAVGHGFNIYRKTENEEEYQKVNLDPIRGVTSGTEFRAYLGTLYDDIERITEQSSENETLTKVRSDFRTANLLTFTYPKMAQALGRLYIDTQAPINQFVTYKLEFVDALDRPTGDTIEQSTILLPQKPLAPIYLRAENQNNRVTLYWQYPVLNENSDDKVIQFYVYRVDPTTNQHQQVNEKVILKNDALFEYAYSFEVAYTGQTEQFYVKAIDISGQQSDPSDILHYETNDNTSPSAFIHVDARVLSGRRVQIQWQPSTKKDIAGYNIYRSPYLSDSSSYVRLNPQLLSSVETTYNDTLLANSLDNVYFYRITALDSQGNEGRSSTAAMALLPDATPPEAPTNPVAEFRNGVIELAWTQAETPEDFKSFIVLRHLIGPDAPLVPSRINPALLADTFFTDIGIAGNGFREGARYMYEIIGIDHAGNQSESSTVHIQIPDGSPPSPPNGVQALRDNASRIAVFWNPSPSTDVMSYLIYRRESGSSRIQVTPVPNLRNRFYDTSVELGVDYEYWVTAADHSGNESPPSESEIIQMEDTIAPRNVRNVQVIATSANVSTIKWEPVPSVDLAGYRVYRANTMTGLFEPLFDQLITTTQWIDEDAVGNAWYKVFAIDTSGNVSPPSNPKRVFSPLNTTN